MNEKYVEKITSMLSEIDRILNTENLRPTELQKFFVMEQHLNSVLQDLDSKDYQYQLEDEAYRRLEEDLGPLVGEIHRFSPGLLIPKQYGGVKTYERDLPGTEIREFEPNINYDMDSGGLLQRPLVKKDPSKI